MSLSIADLSWLRTPDEGWDDAVKALKDPSARSADAAPLGAVLQQLATQRISAEQSLRLGRVIRRASSAGLSPTPLQPFRLSVISSHTMDFALDGLHAAAARHGVLIDVSTENFGQVLQPVLDPKSPLYGFKPDAVLIAVDHRWFGWDSAILLQDDAAYAAFNQLKQVVDTLRANGGVAAILQTMAMPTESALGSHDVLMAASLRRNISHLNDQIAELARETGSYVLDVAALAARVGTDNWFNPVQWFSYKMPFDAGMAPIYCDWLARLIGAVRGQSAKCLVLDLDNTVWGGVIGDDGLEGIEIGQGSARGEAHLALQRAALDLKKRGVFLAVASKNTESIAREAFARHPDMLLREEDIAVFCANWGEKALSLKHIAETLNIGLDSLVFFDDNPVERDQIRRALPMVKVPEIPADPASYASILQSGGWFEGLTVTDDDKARVGMQKADAGRTELRSGAGSLEDYLLSLDMRLHVAPFDRQGRTRITQLINKTNQFNLTTLRKTETEVGELEDRTTGSTLQVRLNDRFGELGTIAVLICNPVDDDTWDIETWVMSCRVFGRKVEHATFHALVERARAAGIRKLRGRYSPTAKNAIVADLFGELGFSREAEEPNGETLWAFDVDTYEGVDLPLKLDLDGAASDSRPVPSAAPAQPLGTLNEAMRALSRARTAGKLEAVQDAIAQSFNSIAIPYDVQSLGPKFSTDREFRQDYFSVRYGGAPKVEAFSDYRALSESLARRIVVPEWVENKLFHLRPDKEQSLDDWREQIRHAAASEQVARDVILTGVDLSDYFHPDAPAILERLYNLPNPAIVLTSHFGHRLARSYLTRMTRGKMFVLNMKGKDANYTWSNPVEAAMVAMRALGEGRKVLVAPDGPRGTDRADIDVSGYKLDVAHGIHTIGYDMRAHIAWLHVEVHPEGFLPVLDEAGPSYEQGDTKRSYAARVDKYYTGRIESVLEGDPAQLLVLPGHEYRLRTK